MGKSAQQQHQQRERGKKRLFNFHSKLLIYARIEFHSLAKRDKKKCIKMKLIRIIVLNCAMQATVNGTNNRVSGNRWKIIRNISAISSFVATAMNLIIEMIGRSVAWWHTYDIFLNIRYCNPYSPFFAVMPHFSIPFSIVGSVFFFHRELLLAIAVPVALALNKYHMKF